MGEAKRRTAASRNNKFISIGRGLLFPHLLKSIPGGLTTKNITNDSLNSAILYWDRIACPTNNFIHVALRDEETLIREGLLIRPRAIGSGTFNSSQIPQLATEAQAQQFQELDRQNPGFWAFAEGHPEEFERSDGFVRGRTALVELIGALPLPPDDAPTDTLLEFKIKRLPELTRLRHAVDKMYLEVADSGDPQAALQYQVVEIDKACADATRAAKEWWKSIKISDLKSLLWLGGSAAGATLGFSVQMPTTAAIIGGAGTAIGVAQGISAKLKSNRKMPFWYASEVRRTFS